MKYLAIYRDSISDGPGVRVSLYVSGCRNHCTGCHNPESWSFEHGTDFTNDTIEEVLNLCKNDFIQGLTIAGGEPMEPENQRGLLPLLKEFKKQFPNKNIWCYTGYELSDLLLCGKKRVLVTDELLSYIDVLVVGPFILSQRDISDDNRWRGSRNQRVLNLPESLKNGKCIMLEDIPNNS